ncbi:MAG: FAD-binding oxidoreductase, partial [Candidatus Dormibacteria bacterium]
MDRSAPPIEVVGSPEQVRDRLRGEAAALDESVHRRLREACESVVTDPMSLIDAGRDWWPMALRWAMRGMVPARPDVVVQPKSVEEVSGVLRACNDARVPVTVSGGRSGVCGGAVPLHGGVVVD